MSEPEDSNVVDQTSTTEEKLESLKASCESSLSLVHKDSLLTLVNAVTQPETGQTLGDSLSLLFSHFNSSSDSSQSLALCSAFILGCLSALGWEKGELVDQLESKADVTFSLETSYPEVWRRANEMKETIRRDVSLIGTGIDTPLLDFYVKLICLSLYKTLLPLPTSNEPETFYEIFDRLLLFTLSESASIIHSILCYFNCNEKEVSRLSPYLIPGFDLRASYPEIYFRLRVAKFLYHLGEERCKLAMMTFSSLYLNNETIDRHSPLEFVGLIFDHGQADVAKLNKLAESFNQPNYFDVCTQQENGGKSPDTDFSSSVTPIGSDITTHREATPSSLNEVSKARMSFMVSRHHPEEGDLAKLNKFISDHFSINAEVLPPTIEHRNSAVTLTQNDHNVHSAAPDTSSITPLVVSEEDSCCKRHWKKIALIIIMIIIAVILGGVSAGFHWSPPSPRNSSTMTSAIIYGKNSYPVLLGTFENTCVHLPGSVNVMLVSANVPLNTSVHELSPVPYCPPSPYIVQCNEYEYNGRGVPINLGPGSKLVYNMRLKRREHITSPNSSSASSSSYNDKNDDCVRLYLGRYSEKSLDHVLNLTGRCNQDDSIVAQSQCLRLEPNESVINILVVFNITRQDDYYVVYETSGVYSFGTVITGSQVFYDVSRSDRVCTAGNGVCSIGSCGYSFWDFRSCSDAVDGYNNTFNVLIQSANDSDVLVNITSDDSESPGYSCTATASFIGAMVIIGLLLIVIFFCIFVWCYRRDEKETVSYGSYGTF
ncbi:PREDICTED: uncharacterized protein LOC109588998 isoform X2 [Amphimedon queenslandica]|uniref:Uncharacterized protein n=1 Tax=Amphimedon queenslandica TaxID=400682 RepID=A0AAN0JUU7_AMPQE|nr:PREDICTED: uncharacterized protein LOC109588998 isoform X2 [Amphimedon queenslandica]|eukprot:XP_019860678.1 PREDICTED: uncharacterized protein LOC109588998 isoform X2 [Amphimedon queenslandica]